MSRLGIRTLGEKHSAKAPGAGADIFATAITPAETRSTLRLTIMLAVTSVVYVSVSDSTSKFQMALNDGHPITAGAVKTQSFGCDSSYNYNLQLGTNGPIPHILIEEIIGGVVFDSAPGSGANATDTTTADELTRIRRILEQMLMNQEAMSPLL